MTAEPPPTPPADQPPSRPPGRPRWWLLAVLLAFHLALPFSQRLFPPAAAEYSLLCSVGAVYSQWVVALTLLVFGGLSWPGVVVVLVTVVISSFLWSLGFAPPLFAADVTSFLPAIGILLLTFLPRLFGLRGTWQPRPPTDTAPWQLSLSAMLGLVTLAAVLLGTANWMRLLNREIESAHPESHHAIILIISGLVTSFLTYLTLWAFGTHGRTGWKMLILLFAWTVTSTLVVYINEMDDYWQYQAATEASAAMVHTFTFALYRLAGWQIEYAPVSDRFDKFLRRIFRGHI